MRYLRFIVTLITIIVFSCADVFGQYLNMNFEYTNKGQQEIKNRDDSLLAYSDSLYGIGLSLFHQGKNIEAIDYFRRSNSIDSLNWNYDWDYDLGILNSPKSWLSYILYSIGEKEEAQKVITSYDAPHSFDLTAEELYNAKPFDRSVYTLKLDSLHKALTADSLLSDIDRKIAETKYVKNTYGENHYLYAIYLRKLGIENYASYHPHEALNYLYNAKGIIEKSPLKNVLLRSLNGDIAMTMDMLSADSLLEEGIGFYKKKKYDKANVCFIKSLCLEVVPNSRNISENIRDIDRYEYPLMWLVSSYQKSNELKMIPYSFCFEDPKNTKYFETEDLLVMDSLKRNAVECFENGNYGNAVKYYTALYDICNEKSLDTRDQLISGLMKAYALQKLNKKLDPTLYKDVSFFYDFTPISRNAIEGQNSLISYADGSFEHHYYASAAKYYQEIGKRLADKYGADNCWYAFLKLKEAASYLKIYKSNDAKNCFLVAQPIFQKLLGVSNRWNTICLQNLQNTYQTLGMTSKALAYAEKLLNIKEQVDGKESERYLLQLANIAYKLAKVGRKQESVAMIDKVIKQLENLQKNYKNDTKLAVYSIADCCFRSAEMYDMALKCSAKMISLAEDQDCHGKYLLRKAKNLISLNRLEEASVLCKEADKKEEHGDSEFCSLLSDVYASLGKNKKGLTALLQSEIDFGFSSEAMPNEYVDLLDKIANRYYKMGKFSSAMNYYDKAINTAREHNGEENVQMARSLKNISRVYMDLDNSAKAYDYIDKAIDIYHQLKGGLSEDYANALAVKASFFKAEGKYDSSLELLDSVLTILKRIETPYSKYIIYNGYLPLIDAYYLDKQYSNVKQICDDLTNGIDKSNKDINLYSNVKAALYKYKSLATYKQNDMKATVDYANKALSLDKDFYGVESRNYIDDEALLAEYMFLSDDSLAKACKMAQHVTDYNEDYIDGRFSDLTAYERTLLWNNYREWFDQKVPFFADVHNSFEPLSMLAYNSVLYSKGILLSTEQNMSDIIESEGDVIAKNNLKQLRTQRQQLNKQFENPNEKYAVSTDSLGKKINDLEKELSLQLNEYYHAQKHTINWQDVQSKLSDNEVAIEFVSFASNDSVVYDAYLLKKNLEAPKVIRLLKIGASETLNKPDVYYTSWLSYHVWEPLYNDLEDVKNIYFAPTGDFYSIAIEALPLWNDSTRYVCDKWNCYRLSSTRQLVLAKPHEKYSMAAVYGGLKYKIDLSNIQNKADCKSTTERDKEKEQALYTTFDVKSLNTRGGISELPATYTEAVNIGKMLNVEKIPHKLETKMKGTEESFKRMSGIGYDLLHIATHGFYWSESNASKLKRLNFLQENTKAENRSAEDKALTRSGLLMTGAANSILGLGLPKGAEDGVLTAGEISQLNLSGLDLVVMSACQTGLGEVSGDGVFGLQRGFKKAGANAMLMSLCKVDDNATSLLMSAFYKNLLEKGMSKHDAFIVAQKYVRDFTITKTINVEGDISDADMKLMDQYGNELPEPVDGKIKLTIRPYKDPRFWAVFILVDGLNCNGRINTTTNSKQNGDTRGSINAKNASQSSFDRWSGKYSIEWAMDEEEGPYGTIELRKNTSGNYDGTFEVNTDFDPINEIVYGAIYGTIKGIDKGSTIILSLAKYSIKDSSTDSWYIIKTAKGLFNSGDDIFKLEYKGNAKFNIVPIGKMQKLIKYDLISTERKKDEENN